MSEPASEKSSNTEVKHENKNEIKTETKEVKPEEQQSKNQASTIKPPSQFIYYIPHQNPKNESKVQPRKINSPSSSKSNSRERSREKREIKQSKTQRVKDSDSYNRYQKREKNVRTIQDSKFRNDSLVKEEAYKKTKICPQYQRGQCRKGSECNFAHSQNQLRGLPDFRKTKLCLAFKQGKCGKLSNECRYAHGQTQLRKMPKISNDREKRIQRSPYKKEKYSHRQPDFNYSGIPQAIVSGFMPPPTFVPPYINPYGQQPIMNANDYIAPRQPSTSYNPQNPHGRHYPEYSQPQTNPNNPVTPGGYGNYIAPPPVYYPSASYDYYGQYPVPPPHHPPPNPYGYPGPKPPM